MLRSIALLMLAYIGVTLGLLIIIPVRLFKQEESNRTSLLLLLAKNLDYTGGTILFLSDAKTVSALTGKFYIEQGKYNAFYHFINWMFSDKNHCKHSYQKEFK